MPAQNDEGLPPIVLLMTAHNRQSSLEQSLASLEPEIHLLDIVLVDDGSGPSIINIDKFSHYPIHLIRLPENRGAIAASNAGLEYIYTKNYEFIARLDSDDIIINQRFTRQLEFMRLHPEIGIIGSHFHVNIAGYILRDFYRPIDNKSIKKAMYIGNMLHHSTLIMRTDTARKTGFYDVSFKVAGDYDFCWRMLDITQAANLPDALIEYEYSRSGSLSSSRRHLQIRNGLRIKLRRFNALNVYAYCGILASLMDMAGITNSEYVSKIKKYIARLLFKLY
jgi:glycosyltransferase involved in cell wall biosynthesis